MADPTPQSSNSDATRTPPSLRVYVACVFPEPVLDLFVQRFGADANPTGRPLSSTELLAAVQDMDALVVTAPDRLDRAVVNQLPSSVRVIATYSVGTDHIDIDAVRSRGIALYSTPDVLTESCADTAILLMLGAARRVIESMDLIRDGTWTGWSPRQLLGQDFWGRRLGILGMGRIGRAVAARARGFGMRVHYHNRHRLEPGLEADAVFHEHLDDLLEASDFLCVACPSGPGTRGLLDAAAIARLPHGAIVANIARGDIIDDAALVRALETGAVAAAGLDVFAGEPDIHPAYRTMPNVFGLPHIGSSTMATRLAMGRLLCDSLEAFQMGRSTSNRLC
ncbi:MAG TPA: D-glycerate dehydrogenase [Burkholderiaceae bacterium]|nr:D-glycerate dehydrogenase [Burkholderiaceae bacterium]